MSRDQQRAARSFVASARLDSDKTVLDQIDASNRIARANFIQQFHQRHRIHFHPVHRNRNALREADAHLLFLVRRFLRRARNLPGRRQRRVSGILQFAAFVADVPQIPVAAVNLLAARRHWNPMLLGVIEAIFARLQRPLPPRRNDLQLRSQRLVRQFKPHLIVALARASMSDGRRTFAQRHFHLMLRNHRTRQRSSQQILVLVNRPGLQSREYVASQELFAQIFDNHFAGAGRISLLDDGFDVVPLAHIADHGDDVIGIVFLQPWNDDGSVESTGISKNNFLRHERSLRAGAPRRPAINKE